MNFSNLEGLNCVKITYSFLLCVLGNHLPYENSKIMTGTARYKNMITETLKEIQTISLYLVSKSLSYSKNEIEKNLLDSTFSILNK